MVKGLLEMNKDLPSDQEDEVRAAKSKKYHSLEKESKEEKFEGIAPVTTKEA